LNKNVQKYMGTQNIMTAKIDQDKNEGTFWSSKSVATLWQNR